MKFFVVNAFGRSNRGDSVLLDECIHEVRRADPDASIEVAVFEGIDSASLAHPSVKFTERLGNSSLNGPMGRLLSMFRLVISWLDLLLPISLLAWLLPPNQAATLKGLRQADVIISAPGGYIHDTNLAYFIALFHIYAGVLKKKIVILAPQSVGPIRKDISRKIAKHVLSRVPFICARESYTYNFLTTELKLNDGNVVRAGDSAFWNNDIIENSDAVSREFDRLQVPKSTGILGLTVVSWTFPGEKDATKEYDNYLSSLASVIDRVSAECNLTPVVFNQVSEDLNTAFELKKKCSVNVIVDSQSHEPNLLRGMIQKSTIFLGTRFHSCIFAMIAGRPVNAIAYLPKTQFIMSDLGLDNRQTPIVGLDANILIERLLSDFQNLAAAEHEIQKAVQTYKVNYARLNDVIKRAVLK